MGVGIGHSRQDINPLLRLLIQRPEVCEDAGGSHSLQLSGIAVPPRGCITSFRTETSRPAEPQDEGVGSKCVASGELGVAVSDPCVLAMHPPSEADAERVLQPGGHCPCVPTQPGLHRSLAKAVPPSCQACRFGVMGKMVKLVSSVGAGPWPRIIGWEVNSAVRSDALQRVP